MPTEERTSRMSRALSCRRLCMHAIIGLASLSVLTSTCITASSTRDYTGGSLARPSTFISRQNVPSFVNTRGGADDEIGIRDDESSQCNDKIYTSIGTLSFSKAKDQLRNDVHARISISYQSNDSSSELFREHWDLETKVSDGSTLAAAETMACLCHGLVLTIQTQTLDAKDTERLDDFLCCLAEGMVRRVQSAEETGHELVIPIILSRCEEESIAKDETLQVYIQQFLDAAISCVQKRSQKSGANATGGLSVQVSSSQSDPTKRAADLSHSVLTDTTAPNLVPHSMLGALANDMQKNICKRLSLTPQYEAVSVGVWKKAAPERASHNNEAVPVIMPSPGFKRTVESLMAMLFVDAEDALQEIESRIDEAYFELNNDESPDTMIPEFGTDFDNVLNQISESFAQLVAADESLSKPDREWANAQRLATLEQIARTSMHRMYHSHLQNLRDHFGRLYESTLDNFFTSEGGRTESLEQQRKDAARSAEEGFVTSAFESIPQICRPDGELCNEMATLYSCVESLRGLLEDMYEITSSRMVDEEELDDIMDTDVEIAPPNNVSKAGSSKQRIGLRELIKNIREERQKRGPAKWYERWAGKIFIIGLNYIQGWIALQTLRREARRRDEDLPKFPLF